MYKFGRKQKQICYEELKVLGLEFMDILSCKQPKIKEL